MPHPIDNPLRTEMAVNKTPCLPPGTVNSALPAARAAHWRRVSALADDLTTLAGQLNAGLARYLLVLGEFDEAKGWAEPGVHSLAHWLGWRCGVGPVAAREHVRVARALPELPRIRAAFEAGEISDSTYVGCNFSIIRGGPWACMDSSSFASITFDR